MSEDAAQTQPLVDQLVEVTCRLEAKTVDGKTSTGTGFNVNVPLNDERHVPVIITNRHVLEGYHWVETTFNEATKDGKVKSSTKSKVTIPVHGAVVFHPDPNVDLAAIKLADTINVLSRSEITLYRRSLESTHIRNPDFFEECSAIEEVLVIGYPNGIWDEHNNNPIVRRGVTATPVGTPFKGQPEFLIDCAVYPGSSGSPVFVYSGANRQSRKTNILKLGGIHFGFAGVLKSVFQHPVVGQVLDVPTPVPAATLAVTQIPNNLGVCVNAKKVAELIETLERMGHKEVGAKAA